MNVDEFKKVVLSETYTMRSESERPSMEYERMGLIPI